MILDAYRVLTGGVSKRGKEGLYKNGFFFASGIFAGIGLNDVFRLTNSDVNFEKLTVAGADQPQQKDIHMDEVLQYGIVVSIMALSVLTGKYVGEVLPMSAGAITGIAWANKAERGGDPISILPF
jgi:hypothetical protein